MLTGHFIPFVNRPDLLERALRPWASVPEFRVWVIDNSAGSDTVAYNRELEEVLADFPSVAMRRPHVPLTTAQTMNFIRALALQWDLDVVGFQHNDGEISDQGIRLLYATAEQKLAANEPWGALFTNYDVCCLFNVQALRVVGEWDWLRFPFYHLDNDYYHRLRLAGFPTIDTGIPCLHHNEASNTIKADATRQYVNRLTFPISEQMLREKWGTLV